MKKILLLFVIFTAINAYSQLSQDTLPNQINLKQKLINANYQNINSKIGNTNFLSKTTTSSQQNFNDYSLDEANNLSADQESNNIFRVSQFNSELYTGAQNIEIPLFTIQEGNISLPVKLVYHTSGIKVDQKASEVGLGWSLLTGPQINRKINIVNDWHQTNNYNPWPKTNGYFRKIRENLPVTQSNGGDIYYTAESTPDEYFLSLNGKMRRFILTNENTPLELTKSGLWIQPYSSIFPNFSDRQPKDFNKFIITDNDALKYTFIDGGVKRVGGESMELTQQTASGFGEHASVSDWKVSKIEDVLSNTSVIFEYIVDPNAKIYPSISENSSRRYLNGTSIPFERGIPSTYQQGSQFQFFVNDILQSISSKKYIAAIKFSSGQLKFNYDTVVETISYGTNSSEYILKSIEQLDNQNNLIKKYTFNYSNFTCSPNVNDIDLCNERLKLVSLEESNKGKYEFFYNILPLYSYTSTRFDFLGYHTDANIDDIDKGLYYYPGKKEWSLLPYNLPIPPYDPGNYLEIQKIKLFNHDQSSYYKLKVLPHSNYAKAGILEKIKFPAGGEQSFVYEHNDFVLFDNYEVQGAGLRIKETYLSEQNIPVRKIKYEYKDPITNKSSGLLLAPPFMGYPLESFSVPLNFSEIMNEQDASYSIAFSLYNKSNSNSDILNGSYVGYSRVIKRFDDNSYEEYIMKNKNDDYELQSLNYSYESVFPGASQDFDYGQFKNSNSAALMKFKNFDKYGNGNLLSKNVYNNFGILTQKITNTYRNNFFLSLSAGYPYFTVAYTSSYGIPWTYGTYRLKYLSYFNDLISTTRSDYYPSGNKSETALYTYTSDYSDRVGKTVKSDGITIEKKYLFEDYSILNIPEMNLIFQYNDAYAVRSEKTTLNGKTLNNEVIKYNNFSVGSNTVPKPSEIYKETINGLPDNNFNIISYNNKGKIVESIGNSVPIVTIWGYNDSLPIAKIIGATYAQVSPYVSDIIVKSNLDIDAATEQILVGALNNFRLNTNFINFQITTYTYDPLIGVTSVTPPSGIKEIYKYNSANRLEKVIDQNGNILKEFKYNYKH
ncbi:MAG: hypothetical protein K0M56_02265 [Kaistella sp.]|nr:hypothetical protein [Kaistella sp.]